MDLTNVYEKEKNDLKSIEGGRMATFEYVYVYISNVQFYCSLIHLKNSDVR